MPPGAARTPAPPSLRHWLQTDTAWKKEEKSSGKKAERREQRARSVVERHAETGLSGAQSGRQRLVLKSRRPAEASIAGLMPIDPDQRVHGCMPNLRTEQGSLALIAFATQTGLPYT